MPTYSKKELKEWCFSQKIFHELFTKWENSGYDKCLAPSCDRTDDYLGYSLDRLQIMTWRDNNKKFHDDRKIGINNKQSKSVIGIHSITGEKIEFYSTRKAERVTGIGHSDISKCCSGKLHHNTAGGYKWKYK